MYRYYENVLKYRNNYSSDTHYLRMLALAFDRPAIRTDFHLENRAVDFIEAISLLQQAVATGTLKDKSGHVIDQVRTIKDDTGKISTIKKLLHKIRTKATDALARGVIIEHETTMEIRDLKLQTELNSLRHEIIVNLNFLLRKSKIDEIEMSGY